MRQCKQCKETFVEGYLHEDEGNTFCSEECLTEKYGDSKTALVNNGDIFWTTWDDDFIVINEIIVSSLSKNQKIKFKKEIAHIESCTKNGVLEKTFQRKHIQRLFDGTSKQQKQKLEQLFEVLFENSNKK